MAPRNATPTLRPLALRLNTAVWLERSLGLLLFVLGAYATCLLALKVLLPAERWVAPWVLCFVPLVLLYGAWRARRERRYFNNAELAEVLDHLHRDDGAVCAAWERGEAGPIEQALRARAGSLPHARPAWLLRRLLPALAFAALALALPPRPEPERQRNREILSALTEPLLERIDQEEPLLEPEAAEELRQAVEEIRAGETRISREQWEAIENLEQNLETRLNTRRQELATLSRRLSELGAQAGAAADSPDPEQRRRQSQQLAKELQQALSDAGMSSATQTGQNLTRQMEALARGNFDPARLQELARQCQAMAQEGSPSPGGEGQAAGRGGADRGRGDAALTLGEESSLLQAEFEESRLEQKYLNPSDLASMGVTALEPEPDPGRFSPGLLKQYAPQQGAGVSRTRIGPGQKAVVEKFFQTQAPR